MTGDAQFVYTDYASGDSAPPSATSSYFPANSMMGTPQSVNLEDPNINERASDVDDEEHSSRSLYWKAQMQNPMTRPSCIRKLREEKPRKRKTKKEPVIINIDPKAKDKVSKTKRNTQHARRSRQKKQTYIEMMQAYFEWSESYIDECETIKEEQHQMIIQLEQQNASGKPPMRNVPAMPKPTFGSDPPLYPLSSHPTDAVTMIKQEQEQETVDLRSDTPFQHVPSSTWHQLNPGSDEAVGYERDDDQVLKHGAEVQQAQQTNQDMRLPNVGHQDHNLDLLDDPITPAPRTAIRHSISAWIEDTDVAQADQVTPQRDLDKLAREHHTLNYIREASWSQHPAYLDHATFIHNSNIIGDFEHNLAFPEYDGSTIAMSKSAPRMDPTNPPNYHPSLAGGSTAPMPETPSHHDQDLPYPSVEGDNLAVEFQLDWEHRRTMSSIIRSLEDSPGHARISESVVQQQEQSLYEGLDLRDINLLVGEGRDVDGHSDHTQRL